MTHDDALLHVAERYLDIEPEQVPRDQRDAHVEALRGLLRMLGGSDYINVKWSRLTRIRKLRAKAETAVVRAFGRQVVNE